MRRHLSPAAVIALLALFVALSGTATAAGVALITGKQIKDGSIGLADLSPRAKAGLRGARGPQGRQGVPGSQGSPGATGPAGAAGGFDPAKITYVVGPTVVVLPGNVGGAQAFCPPNTTAISGGFTSSVGSIGFSQTFGATFHGIGVINDTGITIDINATVVCSAR
jgi:hypothetical protein